MCLMAWRALLLADNSWFLGDFGTIWSAAVFAYFLSAAVLLIGGAVQFSVYSRRFAAWSIALGLLALFIGMWIANYDGGPYTSPFDEMTS